MPRQVAGPNAASMERQAENSIVASAEFIPRIESTRNAHKNRSQSWQAEAWEFYDSVGELRYATTWFANALSRARFYTAKLDSEGNPAETTGPASSALAAMLGNKDGAAQVIKAMAQHFFVAGEWYFVGRDNNGTEVWEVLGVDEVKKVGDDWIIDYGSGETIPLGADAAIIRMWLPHPKRRAFADSPVHAVLPNLREISLLTRHIGAQVMSRLAGAGLLLLPNEMSFASTRSTGPSGKTSGDPFMATFGEAMVASIADPGDPAALVPIVVRAPGDQIGNVRHLTFWSDLDQQAVPQRDAAIRRLALGLDMPPEVLLGTADVNHWGAWQIDESSIKAHIEPALAIIAANFTVALRKITGDNTVVVAVDTSALRLRPNRSKEAVDLYDRGEISAKAMRRETGFNETDVPDDDEKVIWMLRRIVGGYASASPEQIEAALRLLGVDFPKTGPTAEQTRNPKPDPSVKDIDNDPLPERTDAQRAALISACDVLVWRALERAGNRLKNYSQSNPPGVKPEELHCYVTARPGDVEKMLDGAWGPLERVLNGMPFSHDLVERALDAYTRSIITRKLHHDPDVMVEFVDKALS